MVTETKKPLVNQFSFPSYFRPSFMVALLLPAEALWFGHVQYTLHRRTAVESNILTSDDLHAICLDKIAGLCGSGWNAGCVKLQPADCSTRRVPVPADHRPIVFQLTCECVILNCSCYNKTVRALPQASQTGRRSYCSPRVRCIGLLRAHLLILWWFVGWKAKQGHRFVRKIRLVFLKMNKALL